MTSSPGRRLIELIDACRADSDDLSLPEMGELRTALRQDDTLRHEWDARQRSERVVREAMHDVQVPAGLAERILAAAAARDRESLTAAAAIAPSSDVQLSARNTPLSRRRWMALAASAAAILVAALVWQLWPAPPERVGRAQLALEAEKWFDEAILPGAWQPDMARGPKSFPTQAITTAPSGWQRLRFKEEPDLSAFNLTSVRTGGNVVLFVAKTRRKHAVGSLPYTKLNASGGLEMGAWQVGDVLYVLVVDGKHSQQRLDDFIRPQRLAFAE